NPLDSQHRKIVREAVVTQMIAEQTLRQLAVAVDRAGNAEIRLGIDRQCARSTDHCHAPAAKHAGKRKLRDALRQRHDGGHGERGCPADEDIYTQWLAAPDRRPVMDTDPAMNLIMQPDLDGWLILTAGKLHAIHADVRPLEARLIGIFGVNEWQRDERPAIGWPRFLLWQLID